MDFNARTATFDGFGGAVVSVEGELDVTTAAALAEPVEVAVNIGCPLILDLSECSFMNSVGHAIRAATAQRTGRGRRGDGSRNRPQPDPKAVVPDRHRPERPHLQDATRGYRVDGKPKGERAGRSRTLPQCRDQLGTVHCLPRFSISGARFAGTGLRAYAKGRSEVAPNRKARIWRFIPRGAVGLGSGQSGAPGASPALDGGSTALPGALIGGYSISLASAQAAEHFSWTTLPEIAAGSPVALSLPVRTWK